MAYKTEDNLRDAFGGECEANRRYNIYAEKAEKDGLPQVARLFRAVAMAEEVHLRNHFTVIGGVGTTQDNLLAAKLGEEREYTGMYPIYIDDARVERNDRAEKSFTWANMVEKIHHSYFEKTLEAVKAGETLPETVYYVCQICGNTVTGDAPDKCLVCGAGKTAFTLVE